MRILLILGVLFSCSLHARILDLHSEIRLAKGGEVTVTERITVEGAHKLERRVPRAAQIADVIRNGHPEKYVLEGERLRLEPAALPEGRQLYQITYRAGPRISYERDHDALHWNLAGAGRMTAEVILPASVPARAIKAEASGGAYLSLVRDGRAAFRAEEPIALVVRFPKGVVAGPDNYGLVFVAGLLLFTALVLYLIRGQGANS